MRKKKLVVAAAGLACLGAITMGTTMAYLTDQEAQTNTFTVGKVAVDLIEPDYPTEDPDHDGVPDDAEDLVPNEEVKKNPQTVNTGVNDALIFMTVELPVEEVTLVASDGSRGEKEATELFWLKQEEDTAGSFADHFGENWIRLDEASLGQGQSRESYGSEGGSSSTYVFGYAKLLAKDEKTEALFDKVQLKNIMEGEVAADQIREIRVRTYAIQASSILDGDTDLTQDLTAEHLAKIYDIYLRQHDGESEESARAAAEGTLDLTGAEN